MIDLENIFTVNEITQHIKHILENNIGILQIEGEVSNLSRPASGHIYFSLKDEKSLIKCVFFYSFGRVLDFIPKNGDKVVISGKLSVYERDGQYQILVSRILPFGKGLLHIQFEMLKEKLKKEGLFDIEHKKKLPKYPQSIGIITSETGAVLQDILNICSRRYPLDVYVYPAIVQGAEAAQSLINGIQYFGLKGESVGCISQRTGVLATNIMKSEISATETERTSAFPTVDVIIIGRGGGSFEDLFCFNDERLARAIYDCPIPIISAVGHETDFTICDFVADVRAATPSEAAELAVPNRIELVNILQNKQKRLEAKISSSLQNYKQKIFLKEKKLREKHPQNMIFKLQQYLDNCSLRLMKYQGIVKNKQLVLLSNKEKMQYIVANKLQTKKLEIMQKSKLLESLSPKNILQKGYSIVQKGGKLIVSKNELKPNDKISVKFQDGQCKMTVDGCQ